VFNGVASSTFTLGKEIETDYWLTGTEVRRTGTGYDFGPIEIVAMAFFIDVLRSDRSIVRLWLSRGGRNYTLQDALGHVGYTERSEPVSYRYAAEDAIIFAEKHNYR